MDENIIYAIGSTIIVSLKQSTEIHRIWDSHPANLQAKSTSLAN